MSWNVDSEPTDVAKSASLATYRHVQEDLSDDLEQRRLLHVVEVATVTHTYESKSSLEAETKIDS